MSDETFQIEIMTSPEKSPEEKAFLTRLAKRVISSALSQVHPENMKMQEAEVSVLFTDDSFIAELNEQYRKEASATDVLSFPMMDEDEEEDYVEVKGMPLILGDIVISLETAQRQADEKNQSLTKELALLLVHGTLHLLGYDHETPEEKDIMWQKQDEILKSLNL